MGKMIVLAVSGEGGFVTSNPEFGPGGAARRLTEKRKASDIIEWFQHYIDKLDRELDSKLENEYIKPEDKKAFDTSFIWEYFAALHGALLALIRFDTVTDRKIIQEIEEMIRNNMVTQYQDARYNKEVKKSSLIEPFIEAYIDAVIGNDPTIREEMIRKSKPKIQVKESYFNGKNKKLIITPNIEPNAIREN